MKAEDIKINGVYWDNYHRCLIEIVNKVEYEGDFWWEYDDLTPDFEGTMAQNVDLYPVELDEIMPPSNLTKLLYLGEEWNLT